MQDQKEQHIGTHGNTKRTILVEGNIGAGKSTFLNYMTRYTNVEAVPEPLHKWTNFNGFNLLQQFYENQNKWAYTFQNCVLLTQLENYVAPAQREIRIIERSIYSARYCFAEALLQERKIDRESYEVFVKWFEYADRSLVHRPDLIVYLRTTPQVSYNRMHLRNRKEENAAPFEYVARLHDLHEAWLFNGCVTKNQTPIFVLNANPCIEHIQKEYEKFEQFLTSSF